MTERAQLDHLLLDVDFLHKPTIVAFRRKFGWASVTWLIEVYCLMSRATDAMVTHDTLLGVAEDMRFENAEEIISYSLEVGILSKKDSFYFNRRVLEDQESLARKRKEYRDRQERHRQKTVTQPLQNGDGTREKPFSVNTEYLNTEDLNTEYIKNKTVGTELAPGVWVDDGTREIVTLELLRLGLEAEDLPRLAQILARHYAHSPHKRKNIAFDLTASWCIQELAKEKTQLKRLNHAAAPPGTDSRMAEVRKRMNEKRKLEEKTA